MSKSKPNMLEAFRASTEQPVKPAGIRERRGSSFRNVLRTGANGDDGGFGAGGAGGPFAAAKGPSKKNKQGSSVAQGTTLPLAPHALVLVLILLLAGSFWLGRQSTKSGVALAGIGGAPTDGMRDREQGASGESPAVPADRGQGVASSYDLDEGTETKPPVPGGTQGHSPADRAFLDQANKYTIRAATYRWNDRERRYAWGLHKYLSALDIPVVQPYQIGDSLYVYIGAAPHTDGLEGLLQTVIHTAGPSGEKGTFESAYIVTMPERP